MAALERAGSTSTELPVVERQDWPYGLVTHLADEYYARHAAPAFLDDVRDGTKFWQAIRADSELLGVSVDTYLIRVEAAARSYIQTDPRQTLERGVFLQVLERRMRKRGALTLVLGGKSLGKSCVLREVIRRITYATDSNMSVILADIGSTPDKSFYDAVLSSVRNERRAAGSGIRTACLRAEPESFQALIDRLKAYGNGTAIVVDEAHGALPGYMHQEGARQALSQIKMLSKQAQEVSFVLVSSEFRYPYMLQQAGLDPRDIGLVMIMPEPSAEEVYDLYRREWGMGQELTRMLLATYAGDIFLAYEQVGRLLDMGEHFRPLAYPLLPGLVACIRNKHALEHLVNVARDGFSPVEDVEADQGAAMIAEKNLGGVVDSSSLALRLWPEVFGADPAVRFAVVARSHNTRLRILEGLLTMHVPLGRAGG